MRPGGRGEEGHRRCLRGMVMLYRPFVLRIHCCPCLPGEWGWGGYPCLSVPRCCLSTGDRDNVESGFIFSAGCVSSFSSFVLHPLTICALEPRMCVTCVYFSERHRFISGVPTGCTAVSRSEGLSFCVGLPFWHCCGSENQTTRSFAFLLCIVFYFCVDKSTHVHTSRVS